MQHLFLGIIWKEKWWCFAEEDLPPSPPLLHRQNCHNYSRHYKMKMSSPYRWYFDFISVQYDFNLNVSLGYLLEPSSSVYFLSFPPSLFPWVFYSLFNPLAIIYKWGPFIYFSFPPNLHIWSDTLGGMGLADALDGGAGREWRMELLVYDLGNRWGSFLSIETTAHQMQGLLQISENLGENWILS